MTKHFFILGTKKKLTALEAALLEHGIESITGVIHSAYVEGTGHSMSVDVSKPFVETVKKLVAEHGCTIS